MVDYLKDLFDDYGRPIVAIAGTDTALFDAYGRPYKALATVPAFATGRTATYVIAASAAPAHVKAQADYVCDGTADEVQINAALALIAVNNAGTLHLSQGTFYIADTITIPAITSLVIEGEGIAETTLLLANGTNKDMFAQAGSTSNLFLTLKNLYLNGNKANNVTSSGVNISNTNCQDIHFRYVFFGSFATTGAIVKSAWGFRSTNCLYESNGQDGLYIETSVQYYITSCSFIANGRFGLFTSGGEGTISNNVWRSNAWIGLDLYGDDCAVTGNVFYGADNVVALPLMNVVGDRCSISGNTLDARSKNNYCIDIVSGADNNVIIGNVLRLGTSANLRNLGAGNQISNNLGYIVPGEIRTYSGTIATLTENAYNSVDNPFGQAVRVLALDIYVSTNATATSPNIDCGIGSSATTDYVTLFDDLPGETVGFYKSTVATPGAQTVPQLWASGSGNRYLNMSIKDAAATGMVATYTVTVMGN